MKLASLHGRLRWLIILVIAAVLLPLGVYSYHRTIHEVDELSDGRLAQSARTLQVLIEHAGTSVLRGHAAEGIVVPIETTAAHSPKAHDHTHESEVGFQIFDRSGRMTLATANLASLLPPAADDANFRDVQQDGYSWRVFTLQDPADGIVIRTGERYDSRHDITHAVWLEHSLPLLSSLPLDRKSVV